MLTNTAHFYNTIQQASTAEFKDRGSKFLAFAFAVENTNDVKQHIATLKKQHPKANHFCYAFVIGTDGNNNRSSDNGEPGGSAGKPILNQIFSKQLCNVLVVVVRYFGGTLLGVAGLVNAYKTAAALTLQTTPIIQKSIEINYTIHCNYNLLNDVMNILKQYNATILEQEMQLFCVIKTGIATNRLQETLFKLQQINGVEILKV